MNEELSKRVEIGKLIVPTKDDIKNGDNKKDRYKLAELLRPDMFGFTVDQCLENTDCALPLVDAEKYDIKIYYDRVAREWGCAIDGRTCNEDLCVYQSHSHSLPSALMAAIVRSKI